MTPVRSTLFVILLVSGLLGITRAKEGTESRRCAPSGIAVSADATFCLVGDRESPILHIVNLDGESTPAKQLDFPEPVTDLIHLESDRFLAALANSPTLVLFQFDGARISEQDRISVHALPTRLAV